MGRRCMLSGSAAVFWIAFNAPALGQSLDLSVNSIEITQAIQTGATPLVSGRATFVRVAVDVGASAQPVDGVDALLRVYVDGVETPESPIFSDNGPIAAPLIPDGLIEDDTLNLVFLAPASSNVVLEVEVNPAGPARLDEISYANNVLTTASLAFVCHRVPEIMYVPVDYRPAGGSTTNEPDPALIRPGVGDNFIQAIYPVKDWNYHRSPAPSLLWQAPSGGSLINQLNTVRELMTPRPDFVFGWLPGAVSGNGLGQVNGTAAFGNTQPIRHQRTFAHELGHNFGLSHISRTINTIGVDVEHHLRITESLPRIKDPGLYDIMVAGLFSNQAWVDSETYNFLFDHSVFNCSPPLRSNTPDVPVIFMTGLIDRVSGQIMLNPAIELMAHPLSPTVSAGESTVLISAYAGNVKIDEIPVKAEVTRDSEDEFANRVPFTAVIGALSPAGDRLDRLVLTNSITSNNSVELRRSTSAPQASLTAPQPGDTLHGLVTVRWDGNDVDGDTLTYFLQYSPDGGQTLIPLAVNRTTASYRFNTSDVPASEPGNGLLRLIATDGLNTTTVQTVGLSVGGGSPPLTYMLTPDDGTDHLFGATVVLHASAWDLEDGVLDGASVEWSSNIDGFLGSGRLLMVQTLSIGVHTITVTATDGDGMSSAESALITVLSRTLPYGSDCNGNGIADHDDITNGTSQDCDGTNGNAIPDECEADCDGNGVVNSCEIARGNDEDCDVDSVPDSCQPYRDCNGSGVHDPCDIRDGLSQDCNGNWIPDECIADEADCNGNNIPDACDLNGGGSSDCNGNGFPDECDIAGGGSLDCNANSTPDECDIASGSSEDCTQNDIPDDCETMPDCNGNGQADANDICNGISEDCNHNSVPDECDLAGGSSTDCGLNGVLDECDVALRVLLLGAASAEFISSIEQAGHFVSDLNSLPMDLSDYDVVILAPGGTPTVGSQTSRLNSFVHDGGGLIIIQGSVMFGAYLGFASPLLSFEGWEVRQDTVVANSTSLLVAGLGSTSTLQGYSAIPTFRPGTEVVINWSDGVPMAATYAYGAGRTVYFNDLWASYQNNWAGDPAYGTAMLLNALGYIGVPLNDCNSNGIPDDCDLKSGTSFDTIPVGGDGVPDECQSDCNLNGQPDRQDIAGYVSSDCNHNLSPDECDTVSGNSGDCNGDGTPDECQVGLNILLSGTFVPDYRTALELAGHQFTLRSAFGVWSGLSQYDVIILGVGGIPGPGANQNAINDYVANGGGLIIIQAGPSGSSFTSFDIAANPVSAASGWTIRFNTDVVAPQSPLVSGLPAASGLDGWSTVPTLKSGAQVVKAWQGDGVPMAVTYAYGAGRVVYFNDLYAGFFYYWGGDSTYGTQLLYNTLDYLATPDNDCNTNGLVDTCECGADACLPFIDCNTNGTSDPCDIQGGFSDDCDANGVPDECQPFADCNNSGEYDPCDIQSGFSNDCDRNWIPDECQPDCNADGDPDACEILSGSSPDCNSNGVPDECDADCNANGIPDDCDIALGTSDDCSSNGIPDECEPDCNGNGISDSCDVISGTSDDCDGDEIPDECESPVMFVKYNAGGAQNGSSWDDAFRDLQAALDAAIASSCVVSEVWVAAGTYRPSAQFEPGNPRSASFEIGNVVPIYGGFAGDENTRNARNPAANPTILSGDLNGDDAPGFVNTADNSYHVITVDANGTPALLDGFVITAGVADGVDRDSGGGAYIWGTDPVFANCVFVGNYAKTYGGALRISYATTTLVNCSFLGNESAFRGGGVFLHRATVTVVNCIFSGNRADEGGGIFMYLNSSLSLSNCTIAANTAGEGGGVYNFGITSSTAVTNSILWGNTDGGGSDESAQIHILSTPVTLNYCSVQAWTGALGGSGNSASDPLFVDPTGPDQSMGTFDDNLRLAAGSPCIDAGDSTAVGADVTDLDEDGDSMEVLSRDRDLGFRFIQDPNSAGTGHSIGGAPIVDIGAYEYGEDCNENTIADSSDISAGTSSDINGNGVPDECECVAVEVYGDVDGNGGVGLFDVFCVLDGFAGNFSICSKPADDIHPCRGDGTIGLFDLFAVLDAFGGDSACLVCPR